MEAAAHTLVYDCRISEATSLDVLTSVVAPTLVLYSEGSSDDLTGMAVTVASALPNGFHPVRPVAGTGFLTTFLQQRCSSSSGDRASPDPDRR